MGKLPYTFRRVTAVVIACAAALGACAIPRFGAASSTGPNPHVIALQNVPVYQLMYPGSQLLVSSARPPEQTPRGVVGAIVSREYGLPSTTTPTNIPVHTDIPSTVLAWYGPNLAAQGWLPTRHSYTEGDFVETQVWNSAHLQLEIVFYYPGTLTGRNSDNKNYSMMYIVKIFESGYISP